MATPIPSTAPRVLETQAQPRCTGSVGLGRQTQYAELLRSCLRAPWACAEEWCRRAPVSSPVRRVGDGRGCTPWLFSEGGSRVAAPDARPHTVNKAVLTTSDQGTRSGRTGDTLSGRRDPHTVVMADLPQPSGARSSAPTPCPAPAASPVCALSPGQGCGDRAPGS